LQREFLDTEKTIPLCSASFIIRSLSSTKFGISGMRQAAINSSVLFFKTASFVYPFST